MRKFLIVVILLLVTSPSVSQDHNWDLPMDPPPKVTDPKEIKKLPPPPENLPAPKEPIKFAGSPLGGTNIVFVIDLSGSMMVPAGSMINENGDVIQGTRIDRAKIELIKSIIALDSSYKFNIITFTCTMGRLSHELMQATPQNKTHAIAFVRGMYASGGTGTGPAVALALSDKNVHSVALLTDGWPSCLGSSDTFALHRQLIMTANTQKASVNVFGIGAAAYQQGLDFCRGIANDNGGFFQELR